MGFSLWIMPMARGGMIIMIKRAIMKVEPASSRSHHADMYSGLSLRQQLNLSLLLAMLLLTGIGVTQALQNARQSVEDDMRATIRLTLQGIETGLSHGNWGETGVRDWLRALGNLKDSRILEIDIDGLATPLVAHPTHGKASGSVPGWFLRAVQPSPIFVEQQLKGPNGTALHLRVEAAADDEIIEAWGETRGFLGLLLALGSTVYFLVNLIAGSAFRPVATLVEGMAVIEQGDYSKRLPAFRAPEFSRISSAFNHMAQTLESTRRENKALLRHSLAIQEEERRALAHELHDEFGQCLTGIKLMSASLCQPDDPVNSAAGQIMGLCDRLLGGVRAMLRQLRPQVLDDLGLVAAVTDLIEHWHISQPAVTITLTCSPCIEQISGNAAIQIFRIIQESLTNVMKHAHARHAWIRMEGTTGGGLTMAISDDGRGLASSNVRHGFGLAGIRERVESLGGQIDMRFSPGRGFAISLTIPAEGLYA